MPARGVLALTGTRPLRPLPDRPFADAPGAASAQFLRVSAAEATSNDGSTTSAVMQAPSPRWFVRSDHAGIEVRYTRASERSAIAALSAATAAVRFLNGPEELRRSVASSASKGGMGASPEDTETVFEHVLPCVVGGDTSVSADADTQGDEFVLVCACTRPRLHNRPQFAEVAEFQCHREFFLWSPLTTQCARLMFNVSASVTSMHITPVFMQDNTPSHLILVATTDGQLHTFGIRVSSSSSKDDTGIFTHSASIRTPFLDNANGNFADRTLSSATHPTFVSSYLEPSNGLKPYILVGLSNGSAQILAYSNLKNSLKYIAGVDTATKMPVCNVLYVNNLLVTVTKQRDDHILWTHRIQDGTSHRLDKRMFLGSHSGYSDASGTSLDSSARVSAANFTPVTIHMSGNYIIHVPAPRSLQVISIPDFRTHAEHSLSEFDVFNRIVDAACLSGNNDTCDIYLISVDKVLELRFLHEDEMYSPVESVGVESNSVVTPAVSWTGSLPIILGDNVKDNMIIDDGNDVLLELCSKREPIIVHLERFQDHFMTLSTCETKNWLVAQIASASVGASRNVIKSMSSAPKSFSDLCKKAKDVEDADSSAWPWKHAAMYYILLYLHVPSASSWASTESISTRDRIVAHTLHLLDALTFRTSMDASATLQLAIELKHCFLHPSMDAVLNDLPCLQLAILKRIPSLSPTSTTSELCVFFVDTLLDRLDLDAGSIEHVRASVRIALAAKNIQSALHFIRSHLAGLQWDKEPAAASSVLEDVFDKCFEEPSLLRELVHMPLCVQEDNLLESYCEDRATVQTNDFWTHYLFLTNRPILAVLYARTHDVSPTTLALANELERGLVHVQAMCVDAYTSTSAGNKSVGKSAPVMSTPALHSSMKLESDRKANIQTFEPEAKPASHFVQPKETHRVSQTPIKSAETQLNKAGKHLASTNASLRLMVDLGRAELTMLDEPSCSEADNDDQDQARADDSKEQMSYPDSVGVVQSLAMAANDASNQTDNTMSIEVDGDADDENENVINVDVIKARKLSSTKNAYRSALGEFSRDAPQYQQSHSRPSKVAPFSSFAAADGGSTTAPIASMKKKCVSAKRTSTTGVPFAKPLVTPSKEIVAETVKRASQSQSESDTVHTMGAASRDVQQHAFREPSVSASVLNAQQKSTGGEVEGIVRRKRRSLLDPEPARTDVVEVKIHKHQQKSQTPTHRGDMVEQATRATPRRAARVANSRLKLRSMSPFNPGNADNSVVTVSKDANATTQLGEATNEDAQTSVKDCNTLRQKRRLASPPKLSFSATSRTVIKSPPNVHTATVPATKTTTLSKATGTSAANARIQSRRRVQTKTSAVGTTDGPKTIALTTTYGASEFATQVHSPARVRRHRGAPDSQVGIVAREEGESGLPEKQTRAAPVGAESPVRVLRNRLVDLSASAQPSPRTRRAGSGSASGSAASTPGRR